jgi:hypothetical protein
VPSPEEFDSGNAFGCGTTAPVRQRAVLSGMFRERQHGQRATVKPKVHAVILE